MNRMTELFVRPDWASPFLLKVPHYLLGLLLATSLFSLPLLGQATSPPQPLLFQPNELHQKLLSRPNNLVIIDTRTPEAYLAGHIPTAINLPIKQLHQTVDHIIKRIISPLTFQQRVEALGLKKSDQVIFYAGNNPLDATRALWTFEFYGHPVNSILDGGFPAWEWNILPIEKTRNQRPPSQYTIEVNPERLASKFKTLIATQSQDTLIIDARPQVEFNGLSTRGTRLGHIPNSINLDFSTLLTTSKYSEKNTNISTFIDTQQFQKILDKLPNKSNIILYCNAGSEATALYFSFRQINRNVAIYDGSWVEWSADKTLPIALNNSIKNNLERIE